MSSRLPESYAQKNRFFNCRDQLCVNLDTGELIQSYCRTGVMVPVGDCSKAGGNSMTVLERIVMDNEQSAPLSDKLSLYALLLQLRRPS